MQEKTVSKLLAVFSNPQVLRAIEQQIVHSTAGGIHNLRVAVVDNRLLLQGHTGTYYLRQVALLAAEQVLGFRDQALIELDISVRSNGTHKPS